MSKSFVYDRFDVWAEYGHNTVEEASSDGEYVLAEDAINREAVLQAQIRTLEVQLKDAKSAYRNAGVWEPDGSKFNTYRRENLNGVAMYVKEPDA